MLNIAEEKAFETKIKKWLESKGVYRMGTPLQKMKVKPPKGYWEKRFGCTFTVNGAPDMHIMINGKSFDLELKATHGKPSKVQEVIVKQINDSTGYARIVYPKDWEEVKNELEREIQRTTIIDKA